MKKKNPPKKKNVTPEEAADNSTNKIERTKAALLIALETYLGVVTPACKQVGISRETFYRYLKEDAKFAEACKDVKEVSIDFVESQLFKKIKSGTDGAVTAMIFYLKTQAKHRGYIERKELTGKDGVPLGKSYDGMSDEEVEAELKDPLPDPEPVEDLVGDDTQ